MIYPLRFCKLNSPCMRICTHIYVYDPSEDGYRLFMAKLNEIHVCVCYLSATIFALIHAKPYKFDLE